MCLDLIDLVAKIVIGLGFVGIGLVVLIVIGDFISRLTEKFRK